MLVPLGTAPTWRLHKKRYKFVRNSFSNHAGMKHRTYVNLGAVVYISIIYHIPDSRLNLLNGYDFYFRCKQPIAPQFPISTRDPYACCRNKLGNLSTFQKIIS